MKNYINILVTSFLLTINLITLSMEDRKRKHDDTKGNLKHNLKKHKNEYAKEESFLVENHDLPQEIWDKILDHVYLDPSIIDQCSNIYQGIEEIEQHIQKYFKILSLTCSTFYRLNIPTKQSTLFKKRVRAFYRPLLNEKFLEEHENEEGLYPINGRWSKYPINNNNIARFVSYKTQELNYTCMPTALNSKLIQLLVFYNLDPNFKYDTLNPFLAYIMDYNNTNKVLEIINSLLKHGANPNTVSCVWGMDVLYYAILTNIRNQIDNTKKIHALLQYGANPNICIKGGEQPLHRAIINYHPVNHNNIQIITLLLQYGANPNAQAPNGQSALGLVIYYHNRITQDNTETIKLLLQYRGNPYIKNALEQTVFDIADQKDFHDFTQLVRIYSQNTLKKICLHAVFRNLHLLESQLDILPTELKEEINKLRN